MSSNCISTNELLIFPRELRDIIYAYLLESSTASLTSASASLTEISQCNDVIAAEILESHFAMNTIRVAFLPNEFSNEEECWGPHASLAKKTIRSLVVEANEPLQTANTVRDYEYMRARYSRDRRMWATLLEMPHLEQLEVRMQKSYRDMFSWMPFAPILYELRERNPGLRFRFRISYDDMLEKAAYEPAQDNWYWGLPPVNGLRIQYNPIGFIDVTELLLFAKPTDADYEHVSNNPEGYEPLDARSVRQQLMMSHLERERRRVLVPRHLAPDPALLRVQMWEGWQLWKQIEERRRARKTGETRVILDNSME